MMKTQVGTVTQFADGFFQVVSPGAAAHLRVLYLRASQMNGARLGDRVEMVYQSTATRGWWSVARVFGKATN